MIDLTVQNTLACDKIQTELGNFFEVNQRLKQGDVMSPFLFNLVLEHVIGHLYFDTRYTLEYISVQMIRYAVHINMVGKSLRAVRKVFEYLNTEGRMHWS